MKEMHTFGGCVLACQVSMVGVQAVWEDWELAREIRDVWRRQGSVRSAGNKNASAASCPGGIQPCEGQ